MSACPDNAGIKALSCPSATQCTARDAASRLLTFDPQDPGTPTLLPGSGQALACPSVAECVQVGDRGAAEQDPLSRRRARRQPFATDVLTSAVACPTIEECVVVDQDGHVVVGTGLTGRPAPHA